MLAFGNKILTVNSKGLEVQSASSEVTIGSQTWMSKNLAVDDGGEGIRSYQVSYDGGQTYVTEYYYTYSAAIRLANSIPGWHLPSDAEYETLFNYVGAEGSTTLRSTYGWLNTQGTDLYGFCALPTGRWSREQAAPYTAYSSVWYRCTNNERVYFIKENEIDWAYSFYEEDLNPVRLIKDT